MSIDFTGFGTSGSTILDVLQDWVNVARTAIPNPERFGSDIELFQGTGKYMRLLHHKKHRVRKKYHNRAVSKKGLPGVRVSALKNCYPISVPDILEVDHATSRTSVTFTSTE
jgi:hypothetical protein